MSAPPSSHSTRNLQATPSLSSTPAPPPLLPGPSSGANQARLWEIQRRQQQARRELYMDSISKPNPDTPNNPENSSDWETAIQLPPSETPEQKDPILNLSSRPLSITEPEVLTLGLKFAPTPRKVPDPLEFFERYHEQCQRHYNRLIASPAANPLPSIIEERLGLIRSRLEELNEIEDPANKRT